MFYSRYGHQGAHNESVCRRHLVQTARSEALKADIGIPKSGESCRSDMKSGEYGRLGLRLAVEAAIAIETTAKCI